MNLSPRCMCEQLGKGICLTHCLHWLNRCCLGCASNVPIIPPMWHGDPATWLLPCTGLTCASHQAHSSLRHTTAGYLYSLSPVHQNTHGRIFVPCTVYTSKALSDCIDLACPVHGSCIVKVQTGLEAANYYFIILIIGLYEGCMPSQCLSCRQLPARLLSRKAARLTSSKQSMVPTATPFSHQ